MGNRRKRECGAFEASGVSRGGGEGERGGDQFSMEGCEKKCQGLEGGVPRKDGGSFRICSGEKGGRPWGAIKKRVPVDGGVRGC